jgi:hypothetical protein
MLTVGSESRSCVRAPGAPKRYSRHRYIRALHPYSPRSLGRTSIISKFEPLHILWRAFLTGRRQPAPPALELWCEVYVDGISGWGDGTSGMARAYGDEGITAAFARGRLGRLGCPRPGFAPGHWGYAIDNYPADCS